MVKSKFSTLDVIAIVFDLQKICGLRVNNIYEIDSKTFLIKLQVPDSKLILLMESGVRIHMTDFEWPKQPAPGQFAMKLRKHIKQKRIQCITQLGGDRIINIQFGTDDVASHVIIELYDRGNIVLTDDKYIILNILRPRTDKDTDVRFAVREKYPIESARAFDFCLDEQRICELLQQAKPNDNYRKFLNSHVPFGAALLEHCLLKEGLSPTAPVSLLETDVCKVVSALDHANNIFTKMRNSGTDVGCITVKEEKHTIILSSEENLDALELYEEFHPFLFAQFQKYVKLFPNFNTAVDEFFSKLESQKFDRKVAEQQRAAVKKIENVRQDHNKRVALLDNMQLADINKAKLIELNQRLVDKVILNLRAAIARQLTWEEIDEMIRLSKLSNDPVACCIHALKLQTSSVTLALTNADESLYDDDDDVDDSELSDGKFKRGEIDFVDIDLNLNAHQNACKYYSLKKQAAEKQKKTVSALDKALESAEQHTAVILKQISSTASIAKQRKVFWFEKFYWFISSENYLVVGGRDQQQNELLVKRYLKTTDIYMHADISGASSIVIKNSMDESVPPRTLTEASNMAICYSGAWDAHVVTGVWWVHANQVSKTAPSGEYLQTGSFMIRGRKNFLPVSQLQMGFGFLFRLDDECIAAHAADRQKSFETAGSDDLVLEQPDVVAEDNWGYDNQPKPDGLQLFPDVQIDISHLIINSIPEVNDEEQSVVKSGKAPRTKQVSNKKRKENIKKQGLVGGNVSDKHNSLVTKNNANDNTLKSEENSKHKRPLTKFKKKKLLKYKDQDEEDKHLVLSVLTGNPVENLRVDEHNFTELDKIKHVDDDVIDDKLSSDIGTDNLNSEQLNGALNHKENTEIDSDEEDKADDRDNLNGLLNTLTAKPFVDDVLHYAVPICAPYFAMLEFKYKVKLIPGTTKKSKAVKDAVQIFLKAKETTERERELIKAVPEQDLSKNLPGKVKIYAPNLILKKK